MGHPRPEFQAPGRRDREGEDRAPASEARQREQAPHQAPDERLHGLGQRRAAQDPEGLPRHAQLQHIQDPGRAVEIHVQRGEAALLRGAVPAVQAAHGEAPRLQVQAPAEADVHRGREEDAHLRVQDADAPAPPGDAAAVVSRRRHGDELPVLRVGSDLAHDLGLGEALDVAADGAAERGRAQFGE